MKLILHYHKFSIGKAISITKHVLKKQGQEYIPSDITFRRYAKWFRDNNYDKWVLARDGEAELKNKVEAFSLEPFGRGNNYYQGLAEKDVFEAIDDMKKYFKGL